MPYPFESARWFLRAADITPPVGGEITIKPIGLGGIRIWSLTFIFTASAAVANRIPTLIASDGAAAFWRGAAPLAVAAAGVVPYTAYQGAIPNTAASGLVTLGWPQDGLFLRQGDQLVTVTTALDVLDAYSSVVAYVEEFPSGPDYSVEPTMVTLARPLDVSTWQTG